MQDSATVILSLIAQHEQELLRAWLVCQRRDGALRGDPVNDPTTAEQSKNFLGELRRGSAPAAASASAISSSLRQSVLLANSLPDAIKMLNPTLLQAKGTAARQPAIAGT